VPREDQPSGTNRAIWSGTARIQAQTATTGPGCPLRQAVTPGMRCGGLGVVSLGAFAACL
jgi:hypothetical protein